MLNLRRLIYDFEFRLFDKVENICRLLRTSPASLIRVLIKYELYGTTYYIIESGVFTISCKLPFHGDCFY